MRIAVTGKSGQVVTSMIERGKNAGHTVIALGRPELDLTNARSVSDAIKGAMPDIVVSAAAFTAVDKAESESELAFAVNQKGSGTVASVAHDLSVPLIHISTDYVFDGSLTRPYREGDQTGPTGVYGASKLGGEQAVLEAHGGNSAILRVAWIYSPFGNNFVRTMLRLAQDREEIGVVGDQIGNPTNALDIADGILKIAQNLVATSDPALRGVFHMTSGGEATWAQFAEAIFAASATQGGPSARVKSISTSDYPTAAARPANSRLDCGRVAMKHGVFLPDWHDSLPSVIHRLLKPV